VKWSVNTSIQLLLLTVVGMGPTRSTATTSAMLVSLAYLTLPHPESDIPGHTGPRPLELKTPSHPPGSCMSLHMGVSDQLSPQSKWTDYPLSFPVICTGCQRYR